MKKRSPVGLPPSKTSFNQLVERYLSADTTRKKSAAKGAITRWANDRAVEISATVARSEVLEVLKQFDDLPNWLHQRFTPGSLYQEGDRVFGWWDVESQVQAEELPLYWSGFTCAVSFYSRSFYNRSDEIGLWQQRGFYVAENLPLRFEEELIWVSFPVERSQFWLQYGYALPCSLQWYRNGELLFVERSIIDRGFWRAWKWWEGAQWWYLTNRPELFADMDWWGETEPRRFEPEDNPYAAVLGGLGE